MHSDNDFFEKYLSFVKDSLQWSIGESEKPTVAISESIRILLDDTSRVSAISAESVAAIQEIKGKLKNLHIQHGDEDTAADNSVSGLVATLKKVNEEHEELDKIINPIITSLQFQDRFLQNMSSLIRICDFWLATRKNAKDTGAQPQQASITRDVDQFGEILCKLVSTPRERDVILKSIPECSYINSTAQGKVHFL